MDERKNTRINTLFSEVAFEWLNAVATEQKKSLPQVVRDKVDQARKEHVLLSKVDHLEKIIKKSHAVIVEKLGGAK